MAASGLYLCEYQNRYYIYFPADNRLRVVHADRPTGPWSEPVDLGINAIDPAHIAENGRRFLYMVGGQMAELSADGLAVKTAPRVVFEPWPMPKTTRMECTCLEAPKLLEHNGYYYLNVAEGGTAGPATSHSVISARSRHAEGPWEFSPYNPVVRTRSRDDRWLSVGHGRLVDTPSGKWYMTVHSYENGYRTLGRQLLLLPVEWTADGWFRVPDGMTADAALPLPVAGSSQQPLLDPSDDFTSAELGLQWGFWREYDATRFTVKSGALSLAARGTSLADSSALTTAVGGHSYTVEVDVEVEPGCECGMMLFYDPQHATGILLGPEGVGVRLANGVCPKPPAEGHDARHPPCCQRPPGGGFLFPFAGKRVAAYPGIRRNLWNAAQRAGRLPGCEACDICRRIGESYAAQLPLLAGGQSAGVGSALETTQLPGAPSLRLLSGQALEFLQGG
jgi:xylan 1,4-beta-xylosidase